MSEPGIIVCYRQCWGCMFDQHDGEWHTWADSEDVEHALSIGRPDPSDQRCGCYCCADATTPAATPDEDGVS